jgi:putative PIN family toxin of toxin-antitoxin system
MKIVLDTNVIISAFLTQGLSYRVLDISMDKHQLFISQWILDELYNSLVTKFSITSEDILRVKNFMSNIFIQANPKGEKPNICRDSDDDNILWLASWIKADLIISGDKDLLDLNKYKNTLIISPRTFMEKYKE